MNRRLGILLIVAGGLLVLVFAWPRLPKYFTTTELSLAAMSQPRSEVVVSGTIKNFGAPPFSLETLMIEEPGKEPYRRQISLDADRAFELTLGKPVAGTYRVSVKTRKAQWLKGAQEGWLKLPELVVAEGNTTQPRRVTARDYDYQRLLVLSSVGLVAAAGLVYVGLRASPMTRSRSN